MLVHSGRGLLAADSDGASDPFVSCRVGRLGSAFDGKPARSEHRSAAVRDSLEPEWKLAFRHVLSAGESPAQLELHVKVVDADLFSSDDALGEVRVPLSKLLEHRNELKAYKLSDGKSARGEVFLMAGEGVDKAVFDDVLATAGVAYARGWADGGRWAVLAESGMLRLGELFVSPGVMAGYYANLGIMALAWTRPAERDAPARQFRAWSTPFGSDDNSFEWNGPIPGRSVTLSGHAQVTTRLAELGALFGTNDANGAVKREHTIGWVPLNAFFWREQATKRIGLGYGQEAHARVRTHFVSLFGPGGKWTLESLGASAAAFFHGRRSLEIGGDIFVWTTSVFHEIALGLTLSTAEAEAFTSMQHAILLLSMAPDSAVPALRAAQPTLLDDTYRQKQAWLARAAPLLQKRLLAAAAMSGAELRELAEVVFDALVFAGGFAVPSMIGMQLGVPYTKWGVEHLPAELELDNASQHAAYCWEIMRRFPPVAIFAPYSERKAGGVTTVLNVGMAQRDPRVWGADADEFKLRSLSEYHAKSVGFAEPAVAPHLRSPNSRSCPARDLALGMMTSFLRAWVRSADAHGRGVLRAWRPYVRADAADGEARKPARPEDLQLGERNAPPMTLRLELGEEPVGRTGDELIASLGPFERSMLHLRARVDNKFDRHTDPFTKAWSAAVLVLNKRDASSSLVSGTDMLPKSDYAEAGEMIDVPFGGVRLCTVDEDKPGETERVIRRFATELANKTLPYSEPKTADGLVYFDSTLEAIAAVQATYGAILPAQFVVWEGLETDQGVADLCTHGLGAWCLRKLGAAAGNGRAPPDEGRAIPKGAALEVDLAFLAQFEVRPPWAPYGHAAFLAPPGANGRCDLLGIWVAAEKRLVLPTDGQSWEVAKAGFKSTLFTVVTLREHLLESHWLVSNGLSRAARESTSPDHPLRRLLRPHYYRTALINALAADALMPVDSLGYRMFGFTPSAWHRLFETLTAEWRWVPFPQRMANQRVRDVFPDMPLLADGTLVYDAIAEHVRTFLAIWYANDKALLADAEAVAFWRHFATQTAHDGWRLGDAPTLAALRELLAGLIFEVTVGHEVVGAIVEYLMTPHGTAGKLAPGKTVPDVQSLALVLATMSLTGIKQPALLDDWEHIARGARSWSSAQADAAVQSERAFQHLLEMAAEEIEERNGARERMGARRYVACNPRILESSVSI
ncbi:hypothetical protein KFE25_007101 [Diacronema lutheri]|uniref:C2 domain-containing protein n=1 Tax=Diacronema lutheri TaxID=2081491 RepID=A0A8J5XXD0_DIALT|nr:hypothetical protein KFE25_007101 [Diacronema lutheri]